MGGELWRLRKARTANGDSDGEGSVSWARARAKDWLSPSERALKEERLQREEENVLKFRVDDSWNVKALWTGRVKSLLVSAGVTVAPVASTGTLAGQGSAARVGFVGAAGDGRRGLSVKRWTGSVGVSIAYST